MKVSELTGARLNYWTAKADGKEALIEKYDVGVEECWIRTNGFPGRIAYSPSTNWLQGGPIYEEMQATLEFVPTIGWRCALGFVDEPEWEITGAPTALIAAMRCFVASKFGNEVLES